MSAAPRITVDDVAFAERDVRLRIPFRFGVIILTEAKQAFVRVRVRDEQNRESSGVAAELLVPKWFDKNPALTDADNERQLRTALRLATDAYQSAGWQTPFGLYQACYRDQIAAGAARGLNPLVSCYGPAVLDRAILDAVCRLADVSVFEGMAANIAGLSVGALSTDLAGFDIDGLLGTIHPPATIIPRHTVGLVDPLSASESSVNDGLPETLDQVVSAYGQRFFKIKVGGDFKADVERLTQIAEVLDQSGETYHSTLDGNEQYNDLSGIEELMAVMRATPALRRLYDSILFVEQPVSRNVALEIDISDLTIGKPVIIDESDESLDIFPRARALGYHGVSSKGCKGLYKSFLNRARCAHWNSESGRDTYFMSAEDLSTQAGICVQQDLALAAMIGCRHVERNGHHYANGMGAAPEHEQQQFLAAHGDLYHQQDGPVRINIRHGELAIGSLACPGFATAALPDWSSLRPMLSEEV